MDDREIAVEQLQNIFPTIYIDKVKMTWTETTTGKTKPLSTLVSSRLYKDISDKKKARVRAMVKLVIGKKKSKKSKGKAC